WLVSFFGRCNALGFNSVIYFCFMNFPLVLIQFFTFLDLILDIFYPFVGYREVKLVSKESKHRGGDPLILCFVDFANPACAATTMSALQGLCCMLLSSMHLLVGVVSYSRDSTT
ncbi:hypothetical protein HN51_062303, partial [Arachis hypogaea]